jgi:hypothetical protein
MSNRLLSCRAASGLALLGLTVALTGCPSPNIYGTARTVRPGAVEHTIAAEGLGVATSSGGFYTPTLPSYQARIGLHDRVDLGLRLSSLSAVGVDTKINLLRGSVDLAVVPGVQGTYVGLGVGSGSDSANVGFGLMYLNLPAVVGLNINRSFSVLLTPGIGAGLAFGSVSSGMDSATTSATGFYARMGVGANIRFTESFALHPEVTTLWTPGNSGVVVVTGLGFSFGAQPDFSDL